MIIGKKIIQTMALRNSLGPMDEREGDWETRDPCGPVIMSHCTTRMDTRQFRNKWVIDQFSVQQELLQTGEYISSSKFGDSQYEFWLKLFPSGKDEECAGFLSLFLQIVKCPQPKLQFRVNFTVETPEGPRGCALNKNVVTINRGGIVTASKFFSTESLRNRLNRFTPDDTLTIGAELTVFGESRSSKQDVEPFDLDEYVGDDESCASSSIYDFSSEKKQKTSYRFINEENGSLGKMFDTGNFSDFVIVCDGREFKVHRCILAARSKFFEAMLKEGHEEWQTGRVELKDMDSNVLEGVLKYIYTLQCANVEEMTTELMYAADRLMVDSLKARCASLLSRDLTIENVCLRLQLADSLQVERLFRRVVVFFAQNRSEIQETEDWRELKRSNPSIVARTVETAWDLWEQYVLVPSKRRKTGN